jgi:hypothetical protein
VCFCGDDHENTCHSIRVNGEFDSNVIDENDLYFTPSLKLEIIREKAFSSSGLISIIIPTTVWIVGKRDFCD